MNFRPAPKILPVLPVYWTLRHSAISNTETALSDATKFARGRAKRYARPSSRAKALAMATLNLALATFALPLQAASPAISSASIANGTLTLSGSNFGTKPVAAPYYFQDFSDLADGQLGRASTAAGLMWSEDSQYNPNNSNIISSDGVGGKALSWLTQPPSAATSGTFPHLGVALPPSSSGVFVSFWVKAIKQTAGNPAATDVYQWKGPRAGVFSANPAFGTENYNANPKLADDSHVRPDGIWDTTYNSAGNNSDLWGIAPNRSGGQSYNNYPDIWAVYAPHTLVPNSFNFYNSWINRETWLNFNDVGTANGVIYDVVNGGVVQNVSNLQPRTLSTEFMQYVQIIPGFASLQMKSFEFRVSRVYIDTSRAHVFLGNAPTLAACTGRFALPATTWTNGAITASRAAGIPSGYNWIYASNSAGEINAAGFTYTSAAAPSAPSIQSIAQTPH